MLSSQCCHCQLRTPNRELFSRLAFANVLLLHIVSRLLCAFPRKEVIQPHLPVQLPCYDFVPVTSPAFGQRSLAVHYCTSGVTSSHDVTGGVYKARERIHRSVLTCGY